MAKKPKSTYNKMIVAAIMHPDTEQEVTLFSFLTDATWCRQGVMDAINAEHDLYMANALKNAEKTRNLLHKIDNGIKVNNKKVTYTALNYLKTTHLDRSGKITSGTGFNFVTTDTAIRKSLHAGTAQMIAEEVVVNYNVAMDKRIKKLRTGYVNMTALQKQKHNNGQIFLADTTKTRTKRPGRGSSYKNQDLPRKAHKTTAIPFRRSNKDNPDFALNLETMTVKLPKVGLVKITMRNGRKRDFKAIDPIDITKGFVRYNAIKKRWELIILVSDMLVSQKSSYQKLNMSDDCDAYDLNTKGAIFARHHNQDVTFETILPYETKLRHKEALLKIIQKEMSELDEVNKQQTNRYRNLQHEFNSMHTDIVNLKREVVLKTVLLAVKNDNGQVLAQLGVENLNAASMRFKDRNTGSNKHLNDVPLGMITTWIEATCEKLNHVGKLITLVKVDPYMTTMFVDADVNGGVKEFCFDIKGKKVFKTMKGHVIQRDVNAAKNIYNSAFNGLNIRAEYAATMN